MSTIDLNEGQPSTATPSWRLRAVELAVEKHLAGRATFDGKVGERQNFIVPAVNRRYEHHVFLNLQNGTIRCDCMAGENSQPCSHAGAALLLSTRLAPEWRAE